jgi:hypothetical protein
MSLPHQCECRICGRAMTDPFSGAVFKPMLGAVDVATGQSRTGWMCTKHGVIAGGPDCEQCIQEQSDKV